jgi:hypothetical protein
MSRIVLAHNAHYGTLPLIRAVRQTWRSVDREEKKARLREWRTAERDAARIAVPPPDSEMELLFDRNR